MEAQLARLLASNDPPSDEIIEIVNERMLAPLEELEKVTQEIAELEAQLLRHKKRHDEIQASLRNYRTIVSLVRRLPDYILARIFYHCLPSDRNPNLSSVDAPVLLTRVSSRWRSVAMSSPQLWAQFNIAFCEVERVSHLVDGPPDTDSRRRGLMLSLLNQRVDVIRDWLERSGACPLSVSLCYTPLEDPFDSEMIDLVIELFRKILSHSHRLFSLELSMPTKLYRQLQSMVAPNLLSALVELKADTYDPPNTPHYDFDEMEYVTRSFLCAPRLRRISSVGNSLWWPHRLPFAERGTLLTYLSTERQMPSSECLYIMKECRNLTHCRLYISFPEEDTPLIQGIASLPKLQSLGIVDRGGDEKGMHQFYSSIDASEVRWLDYSYCIHGDGQHSNEPMSPPPVVHLLQRLQGLKKLTLNPRSFLQDEFQEVIQAVSSTVTHLVLGEEAPLRSVRSRMYLGGLVSPLNIGFLIVDRGTGPDPEIMLPNLKTFETTSQLPVSDHLLLRIISSRLELSTRRGCTALKYVHAIFDRPKQLDVRNEIQHFCEQNMAGIPVALHYSDDIRLDLDYRTQWHETLFSDPCSAFFGIIDRSWSQIDLDEFEPLVE